MTTDPARSEDKPKSDSEAFIRFAGPFAAGSLATFLVGVTLSQLKLVSLALLSLLGMAVACGAFALLIVLRARGGKESKLSAAILGVIVGASIFWLG